MGLVQKEIKPETTTRGDYLLLNNNPSHSVSAAQTLPKFAEFSSDVEDSEKVDFKRREFYIFLISTNFIILPTILNSYLSFTSEENSFLDIPGYLPSDKFV